MGLEQLSEAKRKSLKDYVLRLTEEGKTVRQVKRAVLKNYNVKLKI